MEIAQNGQPECHLSLIVPMYNESGRILNSLMNIMEYVEKLPWLTELILVNDGSKDDTAEKVSALIEGRSYARLIGYPENRGKGFAVREGMLASIGKYAVYLDADLSTPIEFVGDIVAALDRGVQVAAGSRHVHGAKVVKHQPWGRFIPGLIYRLFVRAVITRRFKDTQCGMKGFARETIQPLFSRLTVYRFSFDVELLFLSIKLGFRIEEIPVRWFNDPHSTLSLSSDAPRMFLDLLRIRWNYMSGKYNLPM